MSVQTWLDKLFKYYATHYKIQVAYLLVLIIYGNYGIPHTRVHVNCFEDKIHSTHQNLNVVVYT